MLYVDMRLWMEELNSLQYPDALKHQTHSQLIDPASNQPANLDVEYPKRLSRFLLLMKWLLAIPLSSANALPKLEPVLAFPPPI